MLENVCVVRIRPTGGGAYGRNLPRHALTVPSLISFCKPLAAWCVIPANSADALGSLVCHPGQRRHTRLPGVSSRLVVLPDALAVIS